MSNVEHYFENLLFHGHDIKGEPNKNALSKEVQDAVEQCAIYIKYTYKDAERETGEWIYDIQGVDAIEAMFVLPKCSICGTETPHPKAKYCPECGKKMRVENEDNN